MKKALYVFAVLFSVSAILFAQDKNLNLKPTGGNQTVVFGPQVEDTFLDIAESFEGATFPPAGWVKYSPDGGTGWNQQNVGLTPIPGWTGGTITPTPNGLGGSKVAYCTWNTGGATSNDQWLVTPQVTGLQSTANLKFHVRKFGQYLDGLKIKISTTTNAMESFADLQVINYAAADTGWFNYNISLSAYAGQSVYVAFQEVVADNYNDGAALCLDLVEINSGVVPVELTSFAARSLDSKVVLDWATATETNNSGFSIERSLDNENFSAVAFVNGNGTTTERTVYSYTDNSVNTGTYYYRLKQVDFDGSSEYSNAVEVSVGLPTEFSLLQNYPNPFNPSTTIKFALPTAANVKLNVYNALGSVVATLVNSNMEAGNHSVNWVASNNASGIYFFTIEAGNFTSTKKMMLIK
ncbi:MAG: choice-of-anchor J domain-containing protein [bacterium]